MHLRRFIIIAVLASVLSVTAPALAQQPARDAYGGQPAIAGERASGGAGGSSGSSGSSRVSDDGVSSREAGASSVSASTLPFTGMDLTLLVFGGITLLVVGIGARRLSRPLA